MICRLLMVLALGSVAGAPAAWSQQEPQDINLLLGQARVHEDHANFDEALYIYQKLFSAHPGRIDILYRMESVLTRLGRHQDVVDLMNERLAKVPGEVSARVRLGSALFAMGRTRDAFAQWDRILDDATSEGSFMVVADLYRKHNLHDRVESVYRRARRQVGEEVLFARELARLAERAGRYDVAVEEYFRFLDSKPQYRPVIRQHFRTLSEDPALRGELFELLSREVVARPADRERSLFLIDYAGAAGLLNRALRVLQDHAARVHPDVWRILADTALEQGDFDTAAGAYARMLQRTDRRRDALIGMAAAEEGRGRYDDARRYYESVIDEDAEPVVHRARYLLGRMLVHRQGRVAQALDVLLPLAGPGRRTEWAERATFEIAELLLRSDRMGEAKAILEAASERSAGDDRDRAEWMRAEIDFLETDFEASGRRLARLLGGLPTRDVTNDALELASLIQQGTEEYPEVLSILAQARRDRRQDRKERALERLTVEAGRPVGTPGVDRLLALRIDVLKDLKRSTEVVDACRSFLEDVPRSPIAPAVGLALAQTLEADLGEPAQAKEAYERILVDYPLSLEADAARSRIRALREPDPEPKEAG